MAGCAVIEALTDDAPAGPMQAFVNEVEDVVRVWCWLCDEIDTGLFQTFNMVEIFFLSTSCNISR